MYGTAGQTFVTATPQEVVHSTTQHMSAGMSYSAGTVTLTNSGVYLVTASIACFGSGVWTVHIVANGSVAASGEGQVVGASCAAIIGINAGANLYCSAQTTSGATMTATLGYRPILSVIRVA